MPKRVTIAPHLSKEELEQRYRQSKDPVERSHYQILWLLAQGKTPQQVSEVTGYSRNWIYELVWGYNRDGVESLGDGRHQNPGATPLLDAQQQANLIQVLREAAPDGGLWNGPKVAAYLSEVLERPMSRQQGWAYLKQLEWGLRVPRPHHQDADPKEQEQWKKNCIRPSRRSKPSIPTPTLRCGVKTNIVWVSIR
jgi:transposase